MSRKCSFATSIFFIAALAGCRHGPSVTEGRSLYDTNGCASCHGRDGHGDGPVAASLSVRPADFRYPSTFLRGASEDAIANTLYEGVAIHRVSAQHVAHHDLVMPRFDHLTENERRSIALFVISLRAGNGTRKEIQP